MTKPEDQARQRIDALLKAAGWSVQHRDQVNLHAGRGIAVQEFPLASGYGFADYLLYVDGKAAGVIEAKKEGSTLTGVEVQSAKYSEGLPAGLPAYRRPLPFLYESTGVETHFTNGLDPDRHLDQARIDCGLPADHPPDEEAVRAAAERLLKEAVQPFYDPKLRGLPVEIKKKNEITIDHVSQDKVIEAGFSLAALDRAKGIVQSFEKFIQAHKDEITALQILYSKPYKQRLTFEAIKELADAIEKPPYLWNESQLWQAYAALEKSKVKGASGKRILIDLVSLVRFAIHQESELVPFPERVNANFNAWVASQERGGKQFTAEQRHWLEMIRNHIVANLSIETGDFDYAPFTQEGGLGKVYQVFGEDLNTIIEELNGTLAA